MDQMEFASRAQAVRERLYRVAYPYLNSRSQAVDAVDEAVYQAFLKQSQILNCSQTSVNMLQMREKLYMMANGAPAISFLF